ncbi:MAG: CHAT domain-containing protein, partial [Bacteroidales bacterium]|nr:CHAT domain-containing protein [Bacteroidales bacterium]
MFKKISFVFFLFAHFSFPSWSQESNIPDIDFLPNDQEKFDGFIERKSHDTAYRFLNKFNSNNVDYYLSWKTLAHGYWGKGDLVNSSSIAFWLEGKTDLFKNPNELYPQLHHLIGNIYFSRNQLDSAIVNYMRTIRYREDYVHVHDTMLLDTYQNLSQVFSLKSDSINTFKYLGKAQDIVYLQSNNEIQIASILARFADSYLRLGYYYIAEKYYKQALEMLNEDDSDHQAELALLYLRKGTLSYSLGKYSEAISLYEKSLTLLIKSDGPLLEKAHNLDAQAESFYMLKDYENSLHFYQQAYAIFKNQLPLNHIQLIKSHTDIATVYKGLQDYKNAIYHFRLAASKNKLSPFQYRVFGETYWKADSLDKAEQLLKLANSIAESKKVPNGKEIADTHFWLGSFYMQTGRDKVLGLYYLNLAVRGYRSVLGEKNEHLGRAQLGLARYFIEENSTEKALEIVQSSIISLTPGFYNTNPLINPDRVQMSLQSVTNSLGWKALALAKHYEITKDLKYLRASFDTYQLSLNMVVGFRLSQKYNSNLILNKEVDDLLNQAIQVSNKLYVLTKEKSFFEATFSFIEQKKSTALLASLQQNDSLRLSNVPTELIEKENNLKQNLLSLHEKMNPLTSASSTIDPKLLRVYNLQRQSMQKKLDSIQNILRIDHKEYYRLFYGNNVIGIKDVQEQLSNNKVLIDYSITDSLLLAYVISKKDVNLYTKKIPDGFENSILSLLKLIRYVDTENSYDDYQSFIKLAHENYEFLLGDFAETIAGKELLIVPDGILSYLPFDILLTDTIAKEQPDYRKLSYFIRSNISSTLNSAAIYFSYAQKKKPNYGQIIAFAPEYSFLDHLDTTKNEDYALMPLPHVKRELESISTFFNPKIFKGDKATKNRFMETAPQASVLHLAMHAVLNDEEPLKSQLVFSNSDDKFSSRFFTVGELFGMELSADLAVLSACNSGNGKLNKGEGIMSLSTGFQYAGVPSVVMTHWDVNDKYSADLIAGFYTYLAQGLDKNVALHRTKVDMISKGSALYSHPYYWA